MPLIRIPPMLTLTLLFTSILAHAQSADLAQPAPPGTLLERVWHLGRVTGDLERIIAFYHDLLGLDFRGERGRPIPFYSVDAINEFVNAPAHAEFRAAFMPVPGASTATAQSEQVYLEAFEYRNIERHQHMPALSDTGVSSLTLLVRDLDTLVAEARAADVSFITPGGEPFALIAPPGLSGSARSIVLRDPDGYPVELLALDPPPATPASADSRILGARMTVVVADLDRALAFYRELIGSDFPLWRRAWQRERNFSLARNLPEVEFRSAAFRLPGSTVMLELLEFRGLPQRPYRPLFQDIGFGHVAFVTSDIEALLARLRELGGTTLSDSGSFTQINPNLRALYTRDHDGFFLEIIER